jgi:hypothetical protein
VLPGKQPNSKHEDVKKKENEKSEREREGLKFSATQV